MVEILVPVVEYNVGCLRLSASSYMSIGVMSLHEVSDLALPIGQPKLVAEHVFQDFVHLCIESANVLCRGRRTFQLTKSSPAAPNLNLLSHTSFPKWFG